MAAFPDVMSVAGSADKATDGRGRAYRVGDKGGYLLFDHDSTADGAPSPVVNYVTFQFTICLYTVAADGTVTQVSCLRTSPAVPGLEPTPTPKLSPIPTFTPGFVPKLSPVLAPTPPPPAATPAPGAASGVTFATYEDKEKGFSIGYPQGWMVLTGEDLPTMAAEGLEMTAFGRSDEGPLLKVSRYATSDLGFTEMTLQEVVDYIRVGIPMVYPNFNELSSGEMLTAQGLECYYFLYSRQEGTDHYTDKLLVYVDDNTIIYEVTVATFSTKYNEYASLFTRIFDSLSVTAR